MKYLHIIMPMAGEGSRFSQAGYKTPKPILSVDGVPFFDKALQSLHHLYEFIKNDTAIKFTFIVREEHIDNFNIDKIILLKYPFANIVAVKETTRGAVETCLLAEPFINKNDSILIMDCDLCYNSNRYEDHMLSCLSFNDFEDGLLLSFKSNNPRYSYAETTEDGYVTRTAEKNPISEHALVGSYFFTYADDFLNAAHKLIAENDVKDIKEYYVSLLYNYLLEEGKVIKCINATEYYSFGTPEELTAYEIRNINN